MRLGMILGFSALTCVAGVQVAKGELLYDNGKWVNVAPTNTPAVGTSPGYSVRLPSGAGDYGWPVNWLPNGNFDSAADDFTIDGATLGTDPSFKLTRIRLYLYESAATSTANTLTGAYLRIWNTAPTGPRLGANDSRIAAGFVGTGADEGDKLLPVPQVVGDPLNGGAGRSVWTGVYRRQSTSDANSTRPVIALDFDLTGDSRYPALLAGTYWLEISVLGSTSGTEAWVPTEEIKGSRGKEITGSNYVDAVGAGTGGTDALGRTNVRPSIDFAFELYGERTPTGDVNGDFRIDADDFAIIDRGFALGLNGRLDGNLNNDGVIDAADYLILDSAYLASHGGPAASPDLLALRESQFGAEYTAQLLASIPEPAALGVLLVPLAAGRRRR